ncbi:hypothetical protein [Streptomyces anthocyanicus]|uniref:hypothetical protein n=1 Tax=Streptomyces anthocyanicus TaxID=68174 RepID=UPI003869C5B3|nr:hypothetical protein OH747_22990 [Streptomyces anthocyanicus]
MTTGRSLLAADEKLMPTRKMRADQQVAVIRAACMSSVPVGAAQLAEATGFSAKNCGLVPMFAVNTGLLVKAHRPTMYLASPKGRAVARAFAKGEEAGLEALRNAWRGQWFGRAMRERLGHGPVTREGLVAKLIVAARATEARIRQAHVLLDLLVAVGLVVPGKNGFLNWHEGPAYAPESQPPDDAAPAGAPGASGSEETPASVVPDRAALAPSAPPSSEAAPASTGKSSTAALDHHGLDRQGAAPSALPRPRHGSETAARSGPRAAEEDLLALLLPPVLLADLTRLTQEELTDLHGHLRAVASLTAKLRGRPIS